MRTNIENSLIAIEISAYERQNPLNIYRTFLNCSGGNIIYSEFWIANILKHILSNMPLVCKMSFFRLSFIFQVSYKVTEWNANTQCQIYFYFLGIRKF